MKQFNSKVREVIRPVLETIRYTVDKIGPDAAKLNLADRYYDQATEMYIAKFNMVINERGIGREVDVTVEFHGHEADDVYRLKMSSIHGSFDADLNTLEELDRVVESVILQVHHRVA